MSPPQLYQGAQEFGDAPSLSHAAARSKGRLRIENLADRSDARLIKVGDESLNRLPGALLVIRKDLQPGIDKGPNEPSPDGALVVRRISSAQVAVIARFEIGIVACERSQPDGSQQSVAHGSHDLFPPLALENRLWKGDQEPLVR